jgi:hypothetical protein
VETACSYPSRSICHVLQSHQDFSSALLLWSSVGSALPSPAKRNRFGNLFHAHSVMTNIFLLNDRIAINFAINFGKVLPKNGNPTDGVKRR